jgi:hypothetical protein
MIKYLRYLLNFLLFPEYELYKAGSKARNKYEQDGLKILAAAWIVLKVAIIVGIILHLLTPYKMDWDSLLLQIYAEISMLVALTSVLYIRVYRNVCAEN